MIFSRRRSSRNSKAPPPPPPAPSPLLGQETGEQGRRCSVRSRRREVVRTKEALEGTAVQTRSKVQWHVQGWGEHVGDGRVCLGGSLVPSVHSPLVP